MDFNTPASSYWTAEKSIKLKNTKLFIKMASSTQQPELELFRRSLNAILPHSVSGMLHYDVKICLALCTHLLRENHCTCCFVSHTARTLKERFSATWPIAWLITDSSDWATVRQTASQPCSATPTEDNLLEELWGVSIDTLRILLHSSSEIWKLYSLLSVQGISGR